MQAVIMAGGKGMRLISLTKDLIPKPMVPILGKPLLQWQMEWLKENKITDVVLVVGHLCHIIRDYFGDGSKMDINVRYIEEKEPLGTAGSLYFLRDMLSSEPLLLILGDVLFDIDLVRMVRFHIGKKALATLFVHPNSHPYDSDLIVTDDFDKIVAFDSKHNQRNYWYDNCVNAGLYLLDPSIALKMDVPVKTDLEKDLLAGLIAEGKSVYAYRSCEYIKDIGTVERIEAASWDLLSGYVENRNLQKKQKAIFLDRDGTINKKNGLIYQDDQFTLEDHAVEAIRSINSSGYLAIVITNQPVVARGLCSIDDVKRIHKKMSTLLGKEAAFLDDIKFCPHHPDKGFPGENSAYKIPCHCRKPDIGLIEECVEKYNIDLAGSWFVGDSTADIRTGMNAGMKTVLVQTGDAGADGKYNVTPNYVCADLLAAAEYIIRQQKFF